MASLATSRILKLSAIGQTLRGISCSAVRLNIVKFREERKLPRNPNAFGPLTNLPDYSFKDGRPVPFGTNQKRRIDKQREHLMKIKKLAGEIDYAVERHKLLQEEAEEAKRKILDSKLKEKGTQLLGSNSEENLKTPPTKSKTTSLKKS